MGNGEEVDGTVDMDTTDCSMRSAKMTSLVSRILLIWITQVSRTVDVSS